ncbi:MAG: undecaprenyl-phosphate glucose phosphotransferase [Chloroflexi bacterium]|nr:undecaprenyl-phosphate glucose phosphotransferase [Chloroflexota bacterium]
MSAPAPIFKPPSLPRWPNGGTPRVVNTQQSARIKRVLSALLVVLDGAALSIGFLLGYETRRLTLDTNPDLFPTFDRYLPILALNLIVILLMFYSVRLYHQRRTFSRFDMARNVVGVVTLGTVLVSGIQDLFLRNTLLEVDYPRTMFLYVWLYSLVLVVVGRELHRQVINRLRRAKITADNLLVVGSSKTAGDLMHSIHHRPELGYNLVGAVDREADPREKTPGVPFLGTYDDLPTIIDKYQIEQVIIALPDGRRQEVPDLVVRCQRGRVDIKVLPDIFAYMAGDLNVDDLGGTPLLTVRDIAMRGWKLSAKRAMDIVGAVAGLILLSPFLLLTAFLIKRDSKGDVFYTQPRMGLDGRPFPMIKFRSMRIDAEASGPGWTVENDPRVTNIGRFMRRTNWDEMPQLINILLGHMSIVGPRPERPEWVMKFREQIPRYMERHREKAGLTGWAQVNGLRGDTSISDRTAYDLWYVENWSLWLDTKIIIRTAWQTITRSSPNAY